MSKLNKEEYKEQARVGFCAMDNEPLLEYVIGMAAGDDWDGNFTEEGKIEFEVAHQLLRERLVDWLKK